MIERARPTPERRRFPLKWVIRICGSIAVLGLTFWFLPRRAVWQAMTLLPLRIWLLSLAAFMVGHVVSAFKWRLLMGSAEIPIGRAITAHFAGLTANLCLPGAAGGDVVRAGLVLHHAKNKAPIAVGSLADRVLDTLGLLLLAALGTALTVTKNESSLGLVIKLALLVTAGIGGALALVLLLPRLPLPPKFRPFVQATSEAVSTLKRRPAALVGCLCLSMSVQSAFIAVNILLATNSGLYLPAAAWFFAWPLAKLLALAPISLGGLGVREASLAALLAPLGASPPLVVAVGLLWQSILFASGLLGGGVLLLFTRFGRARRLAADAPLPTPPRPDQSLS
jgi:glycosyltransferase 2 family protein